MEFHGAALFGNKVPDFLVELVAGVLKAGVALFFKILLVNNPCLEAGMVRTRDIPSGITTQTVIASQGVLEGNSEAVADMKIAVGVGRRHHFGESRIVRARLARTGLAIIDAVGVVVNGNSGDLWGEDVGRLPCGIDFGFVLPRIVTCGELHRLIIA